MKNVAETGDRERRHCGIRRIAHANGTVWWRIQGEVEGLVATGAPGARGIARRVCLLGLVRRAILLEKLRDPAESGQQDDNEKETEGRHLTFYTPS